MIKVSYFLCIFKKHYFVISTTDQLALSLKSKKYSVKNIFPTKLSLLKIKNELGDFLCPKNPTTKKKYFEQCFRLLKIKQLGEIEKDQQVYLGEKEEEMISAVGNTVNHNAENLAFVSPLKPYSDKESTMEQELANCRAVYDIAAYMKRKVFVTIKKFSVNKPSTFRFDSSLQGELSLEASCLCQLYFD